MHFVPNSSFVRKVVPNLAKKYVTFFTMLVTTTTIILSEDMRKIEKETTIEELE